MCIILYTALVEFQVKPYLHVSPVSDNLQQGDGRPETPHPQERSEMLPSVSLRSSGDEGTIRQLWGRDRLSS